MVDTVSATVTTDAYPGKCDLISYGHTTLKGDSSIHCNLGLPSLLAKVMIASLYSTVYTLISINDYLFVVWGNVLKFSVLHSGISL